MLDKSRVAVLPLKNMSPDPNDEYFADGMTEELITSLSGVGQLTVIARTSVMGYKGTTKKVKEIGRELEVGSVLEGSVRKAGNKVRITAQLVDTSSEGHLWAQNYDRQLDDVFAIQSEIAEKVAGELRIRLVESEKKALEKKPTENTEAYTCFLRGRELFRKDTEASVKQALGLFEKAIDLDLRFAKAYVGVAECHQFLGTGGYEPYDVSISAARTSLDHALVLDPELPEAHASLAYLHYSEDDVTGTEVEARRALELNPNLPEPYGWLAEVVALKGDPAEAVRLNEAAYRLDPVRPSNIYSLGTSYLWTGKEQDALELWKKTEQLAPAFTYRGMTEYYLIKGDLGKAREFYAKAEEFEPTNPRIIWMSGFIAALEGDRDRALLAIKKIEDLKGGEVRFNFLAYIYHALGDFDSFFRYMNKALEARQTIPSTLMYSPLLAEARTDQRYSDLLERLRKQCGLTK
jgi:adenylate cyclase